MPWVCLQFVIVGKRAVVDLLSLSSWCLVIVARLFLAVTWVCQQFVIVVFPDHNHYLFSVAVSNLSNETPTSPLSPLANMAMSWSCYLSAVTLCDNTHTQSGDFHRKSYLMLHPPLSRATIQVANVVNYNCHLQENGNNNPSLLRWLYQLFSSVHEILIFIAYA